MKENKEELVKQLREFTTRKEVETLLDPKKFDYTDRTKLLMETMYEPTMFFAEDNPPPENEYNMVMQMFLLGDWRLKEFMDSIPAEARKKYAKLIHY
jgi:hypothetical protein